MVSVYPTSTFTMKNRISMHDNFVLIKTYHKTCDLTIFCKWQQSTIQQHFTLLLLCLNLFTFPSASTT